MHQLYVRFSLHRINCMYVYVHAKPMANLATANRNETIKCGTRSMHHLYTCMLLVHNLTSRKVDKFFTPFHKIIQPT
jgi:hypothetical protein